MALNSVRDSAPSVVPRRYVESTTTYRTTDSNVTFNERHLQLLQTQTSCTRMQAMDAYAKHNGDIAEAVMDLFSQQHASLFRWRFYLDVDLFITKNITR